MSDTKVKDICALAAIIPEIIDTEKTHICLLCEERYIIAKAILDKYTVIPKEDELIKAYKRRMNQLYGQTILEVTDDDVK